MEGLKSSFHEVVISIMNKEPYISNNGVQSRFEKFVLHLEKSMAHPRIINQFELSLEKFKRDTGRQTSHILERITEWINEQPKNY